jgi:hypothetical protein
MPVMARGGCWVFWKVTIWSFERLSVKISSSVSSLKISTVAYNSPQLFMPVVAVSKRTEKVKVPSAARSIP